MSGHKYLSAACWIIGAAWFAFAFLTALAGSVLLATTSFNAFMCIIFFAAAYYLGRKQEAKK